MAKAMRVLDVPMLARKPWGILALVLNVLWPGGIGSIVAGIKGKHTPTLIVGIVQFVLSFVILGWIWSVVWGIVIFRRSR